MTIANIHKSNTSKNPFDCESSEDEHDNSTSLPSIHFLASAAVENATAIRSTGNWRFFTPFSSASVTKAIVESAISSPSLFPASLSQWDNDLNSTDNVNDDETMDEGSFHDCLSKVDTMDEEETSPPLLGESDGWDPTHEVSLRLSPKSSRNGASPKRSFFDTVAAVAIGRPILDNPGKDDDAVTDAMDVDEHSRLLPGSQQQFHRNMQEKTLTIFTFMMPTTTVLATGAQSTVTVETATQKMEPFLLQEIHLHPQPQTIKTLSSSLTMLHLRVHSEKHSPHGYRHMQDRLNEPEGGLFYLHRRIRCRISTVMATTAALVAMTSQGERQMLRETRKSDCVEI